MASRILTTVLWDFDGTLADTRRQNLRVTRRIVERVTNRAAHEFTALRSPENYSLATIRSSNWRDLYGLELGLSEAETDQAGSLWSSYQLADGSPPSCYGGIATVLRRLGQVPHGIVSQNARSYIESVLRRENLLVYFHSIVGYEEVPSSRQKPAPDGLLMCLEAVTTLKPGLALYIGDHATDAECAANANAELRNRGLDITVVMVGARFRGGPPATDWSFHTDHWASDPSDIVTIAERYS